jgi:hypothetical protein
LAREAFRVIVREVEAGAATAKSYSDPALPAPKSARSFAPALVWVVVDEFEALQYTSHAPAVTVVMAGRTHVVPAVELVTLVAAASCGVVASTPV